MKKWTKRNEFAPSEEEQLQLNITEIKALEDSENISQRPKSQQKPFNKRLLECPICKKIGHISLDCRLKLNRTEF